ncbi:hypothetical protein BgiBS90_012640 [Biomphalaria glabrata]|nr:hypothetical protein BgiBS90_012640 [Biomphalaria glabrata]
MLHLKLNDSLGFDNCSTFCGEESTDFLTFSDIGHSNRDVIKYHSSEVRCLDWREVPDPRGQVGKQRTLVTLAATTRNKQGKRQ